MTNHWVDIKNADVVLIMGGNAAEAHPCGFKWVTEAKAHNKAQLIVVDPRFTRSASVADYYAPIRTGTDIVFLGGVINYLLANDKIQHEYVADYTDLSFLVNDDFAFTNGIFSGYDADKRSYDKSTWDYERGDDGFVKIDPTLADPRCVYQLMKQHYARYTPEMVERVCGTPKDKFLQGLRNDRVDVGADARDDDHVRARLDAALDRLADDPHRRDGAAAARQHRHRGRRHERAARPLEHPGPDRPRPACRTCCRAT